MRWLPAAEAAMQLSYPQDIEVLQAFRAYAEPGAPALADPA